MSSDEFLFYCDGSKAKPKLRGWIHGVLFFSCPLWSPPIISCNSSFQAIVSAGLFVLSSALCFGFSFAYHCGVWSSRSQELMMAKLDSLGICVMMAYNSSPVFVLLIPEQGYLTLLIMTVWCMLCTLAIVSPLCSYPYNRHTTTLMYSAIGCIVAIMIVPAFVEKANLFEQVCWLCGSLCYVVGAWIYATQKPTLLPNIFGYHELFHFLTGVSFVFTWMCNYSVLKRLE